MPILYVHGVGVRDKGESGWDAVQPFLGGLDWADVEGKLRRYVAPALSSRPEQVVIEQVFWGDLGATPRLPRLVSSQLSEAALADPAHLNAAALAEALAERGRKLLPIQTWPQMIEVVSAVATDAALRARWVGQNDTGSSQSDAEARWDSLLHLCEQELRRRYPLGVWPVMAFLRQDVRTRLMQRVSHLRGPVEGFLPYFMGDVMGYPLQRGVPAQPGLIPQRVLAGLQQMQAVKVQTGEKIVVLTHSMGGQLMYDALSAYAPAAPASAGLHDLKVDFWAAAASQLGLFASLNLFVQPTNAQGRLSPLTNLGCLWNIWSPSDFLSFQASGAIPQAQDIAMPLTDDVFRAHMAYITTPLFYQILASKLRADRVLGAS